jgi:hypothetical protein
MCPHRPAQGTARNLSASPVPTGEAAVESEIEELGAARNPIQCPEVLLTAGVWA